MRRSLAVMFLFAVTGCDKTRVNPHGCSRDEDCGMPGEAWRCEIESGNCFCRTDEACMPGEICNAAGFCQARSGCEKNADCGSDSLFCDTTTGSCLPVNRCSFDLQCPLGKVCDTSHSTCVPGCRSNGDCPGSSCRCGDVPCSCTGTTPAELQQCAIGVCDPYFCSDKSFCQFGEQCGPLTDAGTSADGGTSADAGVPRNQCYSDFDVDDRPYCTNCSFGGGVSVCGHGPNYCLIDTQNPGNYFCGADCSSGQSCPRGYDCSDVIVVFTQWSCTRANPSCPTNPALTCTKDEECPFGGTCAIPTGQTLGACAGKCSIGEGDSTGFCTCLQSADCAQESCTSAGECSISRKPCIPGDPLACKSIRCVDFEGVGGCLIGQNCAPADGLSCVQVK
ncbi:MAG: hypothetical protein IPJ65_39275 [Archangiaceae bacterium]|nr:hypothetical protein [Archangiaceae bacterium]